MFGYLDKKIFEAKPDVETTGLYLTAAAVVVGGAAMGTGTGDSTAGMRTVVAILFLCITMPVAAHLLGRAAARTGVPFSDETRSIDLPRDE